VNDLTAYLAVRDYIRPGDAVAFWGRGFVSGTITLLTGGPSHLGGIYEVGTGTDRRIILTESTTLNGRSGVQFNYLSERVAEYPGDVSLITLRERTRAQLDMPATLAFWKAQEGKPYDRRAIAAFFLRRIPIIGRIPCFRHGSPNAFFCSEQIIAGIEAGGLPIGLEPDEVNPQRYCELPLHDKCIPLVGNRMIRNFSTR
jgi:hypothetical protein